MQYAHSEAEKPPIALSPQLFPVDMQSAITRMASSTAAESSRRNDLQNDCNNNSDQSHRDGAWRCHFDEQSRSHKSGFKSQDPARVLMSDCPVR